MALRRRDRLEGWPPAASNQPMRAREVAR
jgi:hypothetical protein